MQRAFRTTKKSKVSLFIEKKNLAEKKQKCMFYTENKKTVCFFVELLSFQHPSLPYISPSKLRPSTKEAAIAGPLHACGLKKNSKMGKRRNEAKPAVLGEPF